MEQTVVDEHGGGFLNHGLAQYHVPAHADVLGIEAAWIDEDDPHLNPMGAKAVGEIGIVGTAAAIASAVHHATGQRVRDLADHAREAGGRLGAKLLTSPSATGPRCSGSFMLRPSRPGR